MFTLVTETDVQIARAEIERNLRTRADGSPSRRADRLGPFARLLGR
jgi:hypothetical protein